MSVVKHFPAFPHMITVGGVRLDIQKILFGYVEAVGAGLTSGLLFILIPEPMLRLILPESMHSEMGISTFVIMRFLGAMILVISGLTHVIFRQVDQKIRRAGLVALIAGDILHV